MVKIRSNHRLRRLIQLGQTAQSILWQREDDEHFKENRKLVGKCFFYENKNFDGVHWPMYFIITKVTNDYPQVLSFQNGPEGHVEISFNQTCLILDACREVSREEFDQALIRFGADMRTDYSPFMELLCTSSKTSSDKP